MQESEFIFFVDTYLNHLFERIEESFWDRVECDLSMDVLTIKHSSIPSRGTFIINRNVPRQELWLASPLSGGSHYKLEKDQWVDTRNGAIFEDLLLEELSKLE
jgi:frataxin